MPIVRRGTLWVQILSAGIFAAALVWGLIQYGAVEERTYYRVFLILLVPSLLSLAGLPARLFAQRRFVPLIVALTGLLAAVVMFPSFRARGYLIVLLGLLSLWLTLVLISGRRRTARLFLAGLIAVGAFEALYGISQVLQPANESIATGTFVNRNHFAGLMCLTIFPALGALYAAFSTRARQQEARSETLAWLWLVLLGCSGMCLAVYLSRSRGGTLVLLATLIFSLVLMALSRRRWRNSLPASAVAILLLMSLIFGSWLGLESLIHRFQILDYSGEGRLFILRDALQLAAEAPLSGIGPGMFEWRFRPFQSMSPEFRFHHAHNDYLETAIAWGIPLAVLFWSFVYWRCYRCILLFLRSRRAWERGIALGCAMSIFSMILYAFIDFNLQIPATFMLFCVVLALGWSLEIGERA